jgi:hypothetical protein
MQERIVLKTNAPASTGRIKKKPLTRRTTMEIKKILAILLAFLLLISSGCTDDSTSETQSPSSSDSEYDYVDETESAENGYVSEVDYNDLLEYVDSTCFESVGYDDNEEVLYVRFLDSGSVYAYYGVPYYEYDELVNADSIGGYYNDYIKGQYDCEQFE